MRKILLLAAVSVIAGTLESTAGELPDISIEQNCFSEHASEQGGPFEDADGWDCVSQETKAKKSLANRWDSIPHKTQDECIRGFFADQDHYWRYVTACVSSQLARAKQQ